MNRFYCENIIGDIIELDGPEAAHLINVMRLKPGEHVELFDGKGTLAQAVICNTKKRTAELNIQSRQTHPARTTNRVIIAASIAKGQRFDWMISKCTELGVDHIAPIICERTVKLAKGSSAIDRYEKLTISAAKQCKRLYLPTISEPADLHTAIDNLKNAYPNAKFIFGGLSENSKSITTAATDSDTIALVGPEGGFTDEEESFLSQNSAIGVRLTETILRTETAAIAFTSILCTTRS